MGACITNRNRFVIVTEFSERGDLRSVLPDINDIHLRLRMAHDIVKGLAWMADHKIIHRDLKLANLLVDFNYKIKIADFGLSIIDDGSEFNYFGGNVKYSPPEILRARYTKSITVYPYSEKTDVYGFGLIFWELLSKETVYVRPKQYEGKRGLAVYVLEGNRPMLKPNWNNSICTLLSNCWNSEQDVRPRFREILDNWKQIELDVLCPDQVGQELCQNIWRDNREDTFEFGEFLNHLSNECFKPSLLEKKKYIEYVYSILVDQNDDQVTFKSFVNLVGWFGPLNKETESESFFTKMKEVFKHKSFHRLITKEKAEYLLLSKAGNSNKPYYLTRLSRNFTGEIVVSNITTDGEIIHFSILNMRDCYLLQETGDEYISFKKLIKDLSRATDLGSALAPDW